MALSMDNKLAPHQRIASVLKAMNSELLEDTHCFLRSDTAIALQLNEFRLITDIDFLCSSHDGYRKLRGLVGPFSQTGLSPLFDKPVLQLREIRADRYGIRAVLEVDSAPVRFEIVRENRFSLETSVERLHGVPTLSRIDAYAEKLLANSDRWADRSVLSRDILDLAMMIQFWGEIPVEAEEKARSAYGEAPIKDLMSAGSLLLRDDGYRHQCFTDLLVGQTVQKRLLTTLRELSAGGGWVSRL